MRSKFTFLFLLAACGCVRLNAQNIYTFAGNHAGAGGYSGNGGYAGNAYLDLPSGVATHDYENVYIADQNNHVVRNVNYMRIIGTYAGTGAAGNSGNNHPADSCMMGGPCAVALDWSANLIIADYSNHVVRRVDANTGIITTIAGNGTAGYAGDGGPATLAQLHYPYGVAVDPSGNIYIADAGNNVVRVVTTFGVIQTFAGNGYGAGLAFGDGGYAGDGGPALAAELNFPCGVAVDNANNVYIADGENDVIRKVGVSDTITTYAGNGSRGYSGDGSPAGGAQLNFPAALAIDGLGRLLIADEANNVIRLVDTGGIIRTIIGTGFAGYFGDGGPAIAAQLNTPKGVAVDADGLIYVADAGNNAVRVVGNYSTNAVPAVAPATGALKIYPNPSSGSFTISIPGVTGDADVTLTDVLGRIVAGNSINLTGNGVVSFNNIAPGNYIVRVSAGGNTYREKIMVQ